MCVERKESARDRQACRLVDVPVITVEGEDERNEMHRKKGDDRKGW